MKTKISFTLVELIIIVLIIIILVAPIILRFTHPIYNKPKDQNNIEYKIHNLEKALNGNSYQYRYLTEKTIKHKLKQLKEKLKNLQDNQKQ